MKRRLLTSLFTSLTLGGIAMGQSSAPGTVYVPAEPLLMPVPVVETVPVNATNAGTTSATPVVNAAYVPTPTPTVGTVPPGTVVYGTYPQQITPVAYSTPAAPPTGTPAPMPLTTMPTVGTPSAPQYAYVPEHRSPFDYCACWFEPLVCCDSKERFWVSADYLYWKMKGTDLPPLVTTSPDGTPQADAGVLGLETTTILFGGSTVNEDYREGGRFSFGYWFDCEQCNGVEANFFFLKEETERFSANGDDISIIARPFFNTETDQQAALLVNYPGLVAGFINIDVSSKLYGHELNLRHNMVRACNYRLDVLGGYRYLRLDERIRINETEIDADPQSPTAGSFIELEDNFAADSDFFGFNMGVNAEWQCGRLTVGGLAKLGLGVNSNRVSIRGSQRQVAADGSEETVPGGFLALESNSGRFSEETFSFVPEIGINASYQITCQLRAHVGYSFLYWSDVVRAGDHIDLTVNPNNIPPGDFSGPARPGYRYNESDFWAHGLNLGLDYKF